jgi:large subunit ribosomal protein L13
MVFFLNMYFPAARVNAALTVLVRSRQSERRKQVQSRNSNLCRIVKRPVTCGPVDSRAAPLGPNFSLTKALKYITLNKFLRVVLMKTYVPKAGGPAKDWYVVNADGAPLGRLAAKVASVLRGKNKPTFTPYLDVGDFIIVINAEKVKLTGNKMGQKMYARHSGYPGGIKLVTARTMLDKKPEDVITLAVKGMLPKNTLGRQLLKKLKVYKGSEHPHKAQMPKELQ